MQVFKQKGVLLLSGFVLAWLLAYAAGAAPEQSNQAGRYDAEFVFGGHYLSIVDHQTNKLFLYSYEKDSELPATTDYELHGTVDLTRAGQPKIKAMKLRAADN